MKGLLLKDLLNLRKSGRSMLFIVLFYTVFFFTMDYSALAGVIVIMVSMLALTTFSYDDLAKWDLYALSLPVTRKQLVLSKYILGFLMVISGVLVALILTGISATVKGNFDMVEVGAALTGVGVVAFYMILVLFPLIYKYGIERARLFMFLVLGIPSMLFVGLVYMGIELPSQQTLDSMLKIAPIVLPIILAIGTYISYQLSIRIVMKKDY